MGKRIISLITVLVLLFSVCSVVTNVYANNVVESTLTLNTASSTAKKLVFAGTDTIDVNSNIKKFKATAENEGIILNSAINENLAFVKKDGNWAINLSENAVADTTVTVKGTFTYQTYSVRFDTITVKYTGSSWEVIENPNEDNIEYNRTFTLLYANEENKYGTSGGIFLTGDDSIEGDVTWATFISFNAGNNNGVFLNGTKTEVQMKKINQYDWYVCLSDAGIAAVKNDVVTIKGAITHNDKTAVFNEVSFVFDGITWSLKTDAQNCSFEQYYINDADKYGTSKGIYLRSNDSLEHDASWGTFISFESGEENGVFLNGTKTSVQMKKFTATDWYVCLQDSNISASTGDKVTVKGAITYKSKRVVFESITLVFDGVTWNLTEDPNLETGRTLTLGIQLNNPEKGIYLIGDDGLTAPGWTENVFAYPGEDNGVFLNGQKTEVYLKKYEDKKWYVCLGDLGITAKKDDVVTIKGVFTYGTAKLSFNETDFIFNGTTWEEKVDTQVTALDFVDLLSISKYNTETNKWEIYLTTTKNLPGVDEAAYFDVLMKIGGKNKTVRCKKSSEQHSFSFELESSLVPQNPSDEAAITIMRGNYNVIGENAKIKLETDTILYFLDGNVSLISSNVSIDEKDITLNIDRTNQGGGTKQGIYLTATDNVPYDINWATDTIAYEGKTNGVFLNGVKTDVFLKKYDNDKYYVCLSDVNVIPEEGDIVVIKGIFKTKNYISSYESYSLVFKDGSWADGTEPETNYTTVTVTDYDDSISKYNNNLNRWELYFITKEKMPGNVDQRFDSVTMNINGKEYSMPCYHSGHRDSFFVIIESDKLKKNETAEIKISGKAKSEDQIIGVDVKEFTVYVNKYGVSINGYASAVEVKETNVNLILDTTTFNWMAGTESGINLLTNDGFAVDNTWNTPIRAIGYDENSGIFYNGKKIDAVFKKHTKNCIYLDIAAGGVFAKDKDKITVKGTFSLNGYGVSYKEQSFYYNGQSWSTTYKEAIPKTKVDLTPVGITKTSSYNSERKAWDIYVKIDGNIPGGHDYEYKTLPCEVNGKIFEVNVYKVNDSLVFFVPETILPKDAKNGSAITLKAGLASDNYGIYDINLTKDYTAYIYHKAVSGKKPTDDTKHLDITVPGLLRTCTFNEELKVWHLFFKVDEKFDVDDGTEYYDLPVKVNGKTSEDIGVFRSGECLYIAIPETVLPKDAKSATLTIEKGAKAVANSGWNGIRFKNEVKVYMFGGVWNNVQFTDYEETDLTLKHLNFCSYNKDVSRWDIYVNVDREIPGNNWFEYFEGLTAYLNGKEYTTYANKAESGNNRLLYISLDEAVFGKFKDGDVICIPKGITYSCGGYKLNNKQDFYMQYLNGTWFEYYDTDVKAPEATNSIWENGRIEGYIPVEEEKGIMFSNVEPTNIIKSVKDIKDITFKFDVTKMLAFNEELPTNSIILRGQPLTEGMDISETALYGYNVVFSYIELKEENFPNNPELWGIHSQEISVWKNGINYPLLDQYRMTYNWKKSNHPFFEYDKKYEYTVSIYNVAEDVCVIEIYCNDELVMRVVDRASDDPLDPARNAGQFRIYAACPQYFYSPAVELENVEASASECYIGEQVRVSATYPAVLEGSEYTVDSQDATIKDGVFIAKKPGTYTVTGKYNGVSKGSVQIKVTEKPIKGNTTVEENGFPIIPVAVGGGIAVVLAATVILIVFLKKRKKRIIG